MPRPLRYSVTGIPQHVVQRGHNREATFLSDDDFEFYLECLAEAADRYACDVHAYVLMINHVHLLVTPHRRDGVSRLMQSVGRRYVQRINSAYRRSGTLWDGRYKASPVQAEQYLLACYRYMELNPVRTGMANGPDQYRWSSYRHHIGAATDPAIRDHPLFLELGADPEARGVAYRQLADMPLQRPVIDTIRATLNECRVLGNDQFRAQLEKAMGRTNTPYVRDDTDAATDYLMAANAEPA